MYIVLVVLAVIIISFIILYNRLVSLRVRCKNAYANIDNQLKRRADLIPNLVEITKGYAKYECETLEKIVEKRVTNVTERAKQSDEISNGVNKLLALSESYPDLKANELFLNLQIELTGTEDKIAYARQFYNDCVQTFNTAIEKFPNVVIANAFKFQSFEYFKASEEEKRNVEVKL